MKKLISIFTMVLILLTLVGCFNTEKTDKLKVISSFTIITDMVEQIGKDKVEVHNLVPSGIDPHDYKPLFDDIKAASDADLLFYNGMNLEGGKDGWFFKLVEAASQKESRVFDLSDDITPLYIDDYKDVPKEVNPHTFINPNNGIIMARNILKALKSVDSDNEDYYEENALNYISLLEEISAEYTLEFNKIPEDDRIIVTSERAFQYLTHEFNITEGYIWSIDTEDTGTSEQIANLLEFLKTNKAKHLFLESNVSDRHMKTISRESKIPIYDEKVFADELGVKGSTVNSYEMFLRHNLRVFIAGLL